MMLGYSLVDRSPSYRPSPFLPDSRSRRRLLLICRRHALARELKHAAGLTLRTAYARVGAKLAPANSLARAPPFNARAHPREVFGSMADLKAIVAEVLEEAKAAGIKLAYDGPTVRHTVGTTLLKTKVNGEYDKVRAQPSRCQYAPMCGGSHTQRHNTGLPGRSRATGCCARRPGRGVRRRREPHRSAGARAQPPRSAAAGWQQTSRLFAQAAAAPEDTREAHAAADAAEEKKRKKNEAARCG